MHDLHPCFLHDLCVYNLVLLLDFKRMVKSLCMTMLYCPGGTCIQEGWQGHNIVDCQLVVELDQALQGRPAFAILIVVFQFLAPLSRRRASVRASVHIFKLEYL